MALLLAGDHTKWDLKLSHIIRALRAMLRLATRETARYMMLVKELHLPDQLHGRPAMLEEGTFEQYVLEQDARLQ